MPTLEELAADDPMWWVCSYPKSGNTWVRALLYEYAKLTGVGNQILGPSDLDGYTYASISPKPVSQLTPAQLVQLRGAVLMHIRRRQVGPLLLKSHYLNGAMGGLPMFSPLWCDKVVHVVRDPREVAPSLADHMGEEVDAAIELMATEHGQLMGPAQMSHYLHTWSTHTYSWLHQENVPILTVTYAGLHRDTERELERMAQFLGLGVDHEAIVGAVERSTFEELQRQEREQGFVERSDHHERFFRRGEAGRWGEEITREQARRIESEHAEMLDELRELGGVTTELARDVSRGKEEPCRTT